MSKNYTPRELEILDDFAEKTLLVLIQEDFRLLKGSNYPQVFSDYAESAYRIAESLLEKRRQYSDDKLSANRNKGEKK